jgi:hypothetical protein
MIELVSNFKGSTGETRCIPVLSTVYLSKKRPLQNALCGRVLTLKASEDAKRVTVRICKVKVVLQDGVARTK